MQVLKSQKKFIKTFEKCELRINHENERKCES